jgi:hypothetical protein
VGYKCIKLAHISDIAYSKRKVGNVAAIFLPLKASYLNRMDDLCSGDKWGVTGQWDIRLIDLQRFRKYYEFPARGTGSNTNRKVLAVLLTERYWQYY